MVFQAVVRRPGLFRLAGRIAATSPARTLWLRIITAGLVFGQTIGLRAEGGRLACFQVHDILLCDPPTRPDRSGNADGGKAALPNSEKADVPAKAEKDPPPFKVRTGAT